MQLNKEGKDLNENESVNSSLEDSVIKYRS